MAGVHKMVTTPVLDTEEDGVDTGSGLTGEEGTTLKNWGREEEGKEGRGGERG